MRVQVTTTVNEGKALIAESIYHLKSVQYALDHGKVLLKGGSTVSCLAEKMVDISLRISGRVSARGTKSSQIKPDHPHSILIEDGKYRNADDHFAEIVLSMDTDDVKVLPVLDRIRNAKASGFEESLEECSPGSSCNKDHRACCYRNPKRIFW